MDAMLLNRIRQEARGAVLTPPDSEVYSDTGWAAKTDHTSGLRAFLVACAAAGKTARIPRRPDGGAWLISELALPAGVRVDARGAIFNLPAGVRSRMVVNDSIMLVTPGSVPDSDIEWVGGTFDRGDLDLDTPSTFDALTFHVGFIDRLRLSAVTVTSTATAPTGGATGITLWACTEFTVDRITFSHQSGGVGIRAACKAGSVRNIYGSTGDDSVSVQPSGGPPALDFASGFGDLEGIVVENVFTTAYRCGVKVLAGTNPNTSAQIAARNIAVRNITGSFGAAASGDVAGVRVGGGNAGYPRLQGGLCDNVLVDGVVNHQAAIPAVMIRESTTEHHGTKIRRAQTTTANGVAVELQDTNTGASGSSIEISDCEYAFTASGSPIKVTTANLRLRQLALRNLKINGPAAGGFTIGLLDNTIGGAISSLVCDSLRSTGQVYTIGTLSGTCRVFLRGTYAESAAHLGWARILTGSTIIFREGGAYGTGGETVSIVSGTPTVNAESLSFRCDVSTLTRTANNMAFNTNAALSCGAGPVVCDGTNWKHIFTGATY